VQKGTRTEQIGQIGPSEKHKRTKDKKKNEGTKAIEKTVPTSNHVDDKGEENAKGRTPAREKTKQ